MKSFKRGIAVLLAALLLIPNMPAKAEEESSGGPARAQTVQYNTGSGVYTIVASLTEMEKPEPGDGSGDSVSGNSVSGGDVSGSEAEDTVGGEAQPTPGGDGSFEADGSYTIKIPETDPFFPYEVQFTCDGEVSNQWFMTPDDTVEIGGHTFRVAADFTGAVVTQMSLDVAGKKVIVYPESKDFGAGGGGGTDIPQTFSLLPLEYRPLTADLSGFTPAELTMVSVDSIFTGADALTDTSKIMWAAYGDDDYVISGSGALLNLSSTYSCEMIVGAADQLAADNIRYYVYLSRSSASKWLVPTVYTQAGDGSRTEMTVSRYNYYGTTTINGISGGDLDVYLTEKEMQDCSEAYISLNLDSSLFANTNYHHVKVYEGVHNTAAEAETAAEITDKVWQADMSQVNAGYLVKRYTYNYMTVVMYNASNEVIGVLPMYIYWSLDSSYVSASSMYYDRPGSTGSFSSYSSTTGSDGVTRRIFHVPYGYAANEAYRLPMNYYRNGAFSNDAVTAAHVGLFSSISEAAAAGAADIKDTLFGSGYTADFSQGVYFSVFVGADGSEDQEIYQLYYITQESEVISSASLHDGTAVSFNGLTDGNGNSIKCYVMSRREDSYGEFNFPTILVGEDVDLTNLAPQFDTSAGVNLYAPGSSSPEVSGKSCHNFAGGPVQYTAAAENGEASMNYWLQVVKPSQGAGQLYVNSLADPDAHTSGINTTREVMLDGYHDNIHDIVLINMGTEAISRLTAEVDSDVVELDEYWTLKGVYDLAGFSGTDRTEYLGELANMAKVRLRVKEGVNEGADISGTLTIKSNGAPLLIMTLTGTIGNPCISTTEIPEAVKYVPYGTMIQNNNKYSWNTVSYRFLRGSLPEGMTIRPNGEIYGVPRETGEFTFTVSMENSASQFGASQKEFTLVVNENTDANVDNATDAGYDVTQRIPALQLGKVSSNQLFVSQGVFDQFAHVYLDGRMLEEGRDYTAESGSTRITILSQTLNSGLEEGTHTLGVEFRTSDTDTLKRAAQNFVVSTSSSSGGNSGNNGNGNNNSGNSGNSGGNASGNSSAKGDAADSAAIKNAVTAVNAGNTTVVAYTIVSGDTLWKIADKFYGDGNLWKKIFEDNKNIIRDANKIYVGQVILIYLTEEQDDTDVTPLIPMAGAEQTIPVDGQVYVVQTGDSLWKIAAKFYGNGRQWRKIYNANQEVLRAPGSIYAGQELIIPAQ